MSEYNMKSIKAWKLYFVVVLGIVFLEFSSRLYFTVQFAHGHFSTKNKIELLQAIIGLCGLYGFIYKRKLFGRPFWIVIFISQLSYDAWDSYNDIQWQRLLDEAFPSSPDKLEYFFNFSYNFFFRYIWPLPFYVALFIYSFKSKEIWNKQQSESDEKKSIKNNAHNKVIETDAE